MNADMTTESFIGPMGDGDATAIANAPTDIEYLLRRLKAAEAVIQTVEFHNDGTVTFIKAGGPLIEAWREVAE